MIEDNDNRAPEMLFVLFVWGCGIATGAVLMFTACIIWG